MEECCLSAGKQIKKIWIREPEHQHLPPSIWLSWSFARQPWGIKLLRTCSFGLQLMALKIAEGKAWVGKMMDWWYLKNWESQILLLPIGSALSPWHLWQNAAPLHSAISNRREASRMPGTNNTTTCFLSFHCLQFHTLHNGFFQLPPYLDSKLGLIEEKVQGWFCTTLYVPSSKAYSPSLQHWYVHSDTEPGRASHLLLSTE